MTANVDILAQLWAQAKSKEDTAKNERIDLEQKILALIPAKEEGSSTTTTASGIKIKLTGKLTYKVQLEQLVELTKSWPEDVRPIKAKIEADETKLKAIRSDAPKLWADIAAAVTVSPAKTGVTIELAA
jgi:hypothetical protein